MKKIAVIGTGIMGSGIVRNFLKHKYQVYVWNRTPAKLKEFVKLGAIAAPTPKEATANADIVFEVSANDESSQKLWVGKNGILEGATKKKVLITSATLSISWIDNLAKVCKDLDLEFFDMPMTGGRTGAETGNLVLLVGGNEAKLKSINKDLASISSSILYFGKVGSGMRYKLILNMLQGIHIAAFGEALSLAKEFGLDIKKVGEALAERPGGTTTNIAWRDYQKEPSPINFSVEWIFKDLNYAKKATTKTNTDFLDQTLKRYRLAVKKKYKQKDWTYINKMQG